MLAKCNASISRDIQKEGFLVRLYFLWSKEICDTLGCLKGLYDGREAQVTSGDIEEEVMEAVPENHNNGTTSIGQSVGISQSNAVNILKKKKKFRPHHLQLDQELHGAKFNNRVENWLLDKLLADG
jgi:hypothetical protein